MHDKLIGLFLFSEMTVTERSYSHLLEMYALSKLQLQTILQEDGAPPDYCQHVRNHIEREMAGRWIGGIGPNAWFPRSPDLTPWDFFL
jgi:hypothetical protein